MRFNQGSDYPDPTITKVQARRGPRPPAGRHAGGHPRGAGRGSCAAGARAPSSAASGSRLTGAGQHRQQGGGHLGRALLVGEQRRPRARPRGRASGKVATISSAHASGKNGSWSPHTSWTGTSMRRWSSPRSVHDAARRSCAAAGCRRRGARAGRAAGARKNSSNSPSSSDRVDEGVAEHELVPAQPRLAGDPAEAGAEAGQVPPGEEQLEPPAQPVAAARCRSGPSPAGGGRRPARDGRSCRRCRGRRRRRRRAPSRSTTRRTLSTCWSMVNRRARRRSGWSRCRAGR